MFFLTKICQVLEKIDDKEGKVSGQKEGRRRYKNIGDTHRMKLKSDSLRHKNLSRNNQKEGQ